MKSVEGSSPTARVIRDALSGRALRAWRYRVEERRSMPQALRAKEDHARAVIDWLLRAQKATPDDGVAESYNPITRRWRPSYPETTGYIICSLLRAVDAGLGRNGELSGAAVQMGRWLTTTQMHDGAFPSGTVGRKKPRPAVFNTGQILKGLTDLLARGLDATGEIRRSAEKAADWMIRIQDDDGCWRKGISDLTTAVVHAYNVRAAWGLERYGRAVGDTRAIEAGVKNCRWVCSVQGKDGWFEHMAFDTGMPPLTHTIAYTIQGVLEIGAATGTAEFVSRAANAASAVFATQDPDSGSLPGQFVERWRPVPGWTSNTGNAQMAIVGHRLATLTSNEDWRGKAVRALSFCRGLQELDADDPGRRGAVRGSFPGHLGYGRYWYMNWTQKFFLDGLLCELGIEIV